MMMMLVRAIRTRRHSSYPCWSQQLPYRLSKTPAEASAWHRTLTQLLHMKISYNSHLWLTPWDNTPGLMWNLTVLILPRNNSSWILYLPLDNLIRLCSWELPEQWQREGRKAPERVLQGIWAETGLPAQRCSSPALWSQGLTSGHAFVTFTNGPWAAPQAPC